MASGNGKMRVSIGADHGNVQASFETFDSDGETVVMSKIFTMSPAGARTIASQYLAAARQAESQMPRMPDDIRVAPSQRRRPNQIVPLISVFDDMAERIPADLVVTYTPGHLVLRTPANWATFYYGKPEICRLVHHYFRPRPGVEVTVKDGLIVMERTR